MSTIGLSTSLGVDWISTPAVQNIPTSRTEYPKKEERVHISFSHKLENRHLEVE